MYRIKTKYVDYLLRKRTAIDYASSEWKAERIKEIHYDLIEYENGKLLEQKVEKGHFITEKEIYNYKSKIGGGH